jgi:hypothetical protein
MQLAERSSGNSVLALCMFSLLAVAPRPTVVEPVSPPELADEELVTPEAMASASELPDCTAVTDSYQSVLTCARPALLRCFAGAQTRVDLVIDIARDGRVTHVATRRSTPETPVSRCLASQIEQLTFPGTDTSVVILVPLVARS